MELLIKAAAARGASDLHLTCGLPPKLRIDGVLTDLEGAPPLTHADCEEYANRLSEGKADAIRKMGELDLSRTIAGSRVRIHLFRQQGHISAAVRLLSSEIPSLEQINLPPAARNLIQMRQGLILVTGETGSGKSTTLAALLNAVNQQYGGHILTLEDPIEYLYPPGRAIVSQREIGRDTASYAAGLRAALREDPDRILIGEMRDLDTIETALTAAETGRLVFATLHTGSAAGSIDRIVSVFPQGRQQQIRLQLSMTLQAVLSQQLLPRADQKGRVLACEVMIVNAAVRNLIREGKTPQIANTLATSAKEGSQTMDNAILNLYQRRIISASVARTFARDRDGLRKSIPGGG